MRNVDQKKEISNTKLARMAGKGIMKAEKTKEADMITFICYPRCSTCKKAQKWLDDNGIEYKFRDIKEKNPSEKELRKWHKKSGLPLKKFFNTSGNLYKDLHLKDKLPTMSDDEQFALLATDGMLVKRPILITGDTVLVGFKEAEYQAALK